MKRLLVLALLALGCAGQLFAESETEKRKQLMLEHESRPASAEALARRDRTNTFLQAKNVPLAKSLPVIEDTETATFRSPRAIAERLIGCTIVAVAGQTNDLKFTKQLMAEFGAEPLLTPGERKFLDEQLDDRRQRIQFSWQYERAWVLLWALGYVDRLDYPTDECDVGFLKQVLTSRNLEQIVAGAKPRTPAEILDEADLIYRLHWAVVEARVTPKTKVPEEVEKGVVQERHHALNWLIGYLGQDWDDVTTDT
jgi:hypothetical protein